MPQSSLEMTNTTVALDQTDQLMHTAEFGLLKLVLGSIQALLVLVCVPLFIHKQQQPMVKCRSWKLTILGCISMTVVMYIDAWLSMDGWVSYGMQSRLYFFKHIGSFLLWYGLGYPDDHSHTIAQFYTRTILAFTSSFVTFAGFMTNEKKMIDISIIISTLLLFWTVLVDLVVPLRLMIFSKHHRVVDIQHRSIESQQEHGVSGPTLLEDHIIHQHQDCLIESSHHRESSASTLNPTMDLVANSQLSIAHILNSMTLYDAFGLYLSREFSLENLLFLKTVELYKLRVSTNPAHVSFTLLTQPIHNEFVCPNSINQVNLPKSIVSRIECKLRALKDEEALEAIRKTNAVNPMAIQMKSEIIELASSIFDEAAEHIEHMLIHHLRRFKSSEFFPK
ncbi:hypothetical protein BATDEDRAFT_21509 [Batrachochytrium dendrobatidis JAM81]|uniref:RGS domain-containing protein n=2 Tax=Batrachochytrium dendrobatidis TaxID=109871 RepID=F4NTH9_BATDJ|nr:uncharacterized protein BATDEDRAFT_21509 [Batrachochytrium dendrobatidis JAM81]EGF83114.1 hypothetical protein BATDEDRAFT_21509 [Batrachochytrium dendrobatidis JAM81]|eukprot:XP_006675307.1 hypothetical protein BATDEDRAFT_21509 [Batrachochytrium dendrobatidis JAM81]